MVILWSMGGAKSYCEKVFKTFVAWNLKLQGLEIGSLTWQWGQSMIGVPKKTISFLYSLDPLI
jgi:hypothetical protein